MIINDKQDRHKSKIDIKYTKIPTPLYSTKTKMVLNMLVCPMKHWLKTTKEVCQTLKTVLIKECTPLA